MNILKVKNIDNSYEHVANNFLIYLYNYVKSPVTNKNESLLEGKIEVNKGYQSMIDYLTDLYNKFYIMISRNAYIEFEDEILKQYLANELGDGLGIIENDVKDLTRYDLNDVIFIPNGVTKFNELRYFKSLTEMMETVNGGLCNIFNECKDTLEEINLKNVVKIGGDAFRKCTALKTLNDTHNITTLYGRCFEGCTSLPNIYFDNIETFNSEVFMNCTSLKTAYVDGPITRFNYSSQFNNCTSLESISGFSNITNVSEYMFYNCSSLTTIDIPFENITNIYKSAFNGCTLFDIKNKDISNVTNFGERCFANSGCTGITSFSSNNISFGGAIFNTSKIKSIIIPNNVSTSIGSYSNMFANCTDLTSVSLPTNQQSFEIPWQCFYNCTSLTTLNYNTEATITAIRKEAFRGCTSFPSFDFSKVQLIEESAFRDCTSLSSIVNLESCTSAGSAVFMNCTSIPSIINVENLTKINYGVFYNCGNSEHPFGKLTFSNVTTIGYSGFEQSKGITELEFSSNLASIEHHAFSGCTNLTSITGLDNVAILTYQTFRYCSSLENLDLPGVTSISGGYNFDGCNNLNVVNLPNLTTITSNDVFRGSNIQTLNLNSLEIIDKTYFVGNVKNLNIPKVKTTNQNFKDNALLENVDASSLESGVRYQFQNTKIKTISLPKMIIIPQDGFRSCADLTTVNITSVTTTLGQSCFNTCGKLANIDTSHIETINGWAFENCTSLKSVDLSSCTSLGQGAFKGCTGLNTDIVVPAAITSLPAEVFMNAPNIKSIYFASPTRIAWASNLINSGTYPIYVPNDLVSSYKSAWTSVASRIYSINDKPAS